MVVPAQFLLQIGPNACTEARRSARVGLSAGRSAAVYFGYWAVSELISTVPRGTTPSSIRRSISMPGTPARSKGTMEAVKRPPLSRGRSWVQNGASRLEY
ncbi:hypothetical protein SAMN04489709_1514 [Paracidovorax citrulli]|nr:hypothetical protein SAMN04489709_1514 [Paracidovorax citrulli]